MTQIKAVIFDMDGLLVDSEPVWDKARAAMAAEASKAWTEDDHKAVMGVSTQEWVDYMIERLDLTLPPAQVQQHIIDRMVEMYQQGVPYRPGAVAAVDLAHTHYPTGVASGSPQVLIDAVTGDAAVAGKFQVVLSADNVARGKPNPDVYLAVAERLGVDPAACVCLEDSGNGILSGSRAGMKVIAVPDHRFPPSTAKLAHAHVVLDSLEAFTLDTIRELETV